MRNNIQLLNQLLQKTADAFCMELSDLIGKRNTTLHVSARTAFIVAARDKGYTWARIGHAINRNHSTVITRYHATIDRMRNFPEHCLQITEVINFAQHAA